MGEQATHRTVMWARPVYGSMMNTNCQEPESAGRKKDHRGPGSSPKAVTPQDTIEAPPSSKHGQLKGPSYNGLHRKGLDSTKYGQDVTR